MKINRLKDRYRKAYKKLAIKLKENIVQKHLLTILSSRI
mgnify:CR=1 FL=1